VLLGATVRPDCPAPDQRSSALSPELATLKFDCFPAPQFICFCPIHPFAYSPAHLLFFFFPLLVAASIATSIAASGCRFAKQNHCAVQYCQPIADVECTGELKLVFHCSLRSRCSFSRPFRVCQTIRENSKSTAETQRNPHYVRVRGDDLKARKMGTLTTFRSGLNILTAGLYFQSGHDLQ